MTWNPGDLAQCIGGQPWRDRHGREDTGPKRNQILLVRDVHEYRNGRTGLNFATWPGLYYDAREFRKLDGNAPEVGRRSKKKEPAHEVV